MNDRIIKALSAVDDHCTAHGSGSNNDAAGTDRNAAGNVARDTAYDACRAGDGKTGGKAFDHGADFANRLVQRQRAARTLAVWYMADARAFRKKISSVPRIPTEEAAHNMGATSFSFFHSSLLRQISAAVFFCPRA